MSDENLTHVILRELREELRQFRGETSARFDRIEIEMAELRGEMRETRTALTAIGYPVNLSTGDMKAELHATPDRIGRLERERALASPAIVRLTPRPSRRSRASSGVRAATARPPTPWRGTRRARRDARPSGARGP